MPTYIGYSTLGVNLPRTIEQTGIGGGVATLTQPVRLGKKFRIVDQALVVQDFVNAFNIRQGEKVGQPDYGTTIWNYVFEPNTEEAKTSIENEVRRVASLDPRIQLSTVSIYEYDHGLLIQVEMYVNPFTEQVQIQFELNRQTNFASVLA